MLSTQLHRTSALLLVALIATGCTDNDGNSNSTGNDPGSGAGPAEALSGIDTDSDGDGDGIVDLPTSVPVEVRDVFSRYTAVEGGGGDRIHLLAQPGVPDEKLRRAREVMNQHLSPVPGTSEGASKADVLAAMAARGATLAIFTDPSTADPFDPANRAFLDLFGDRAWALLASRIVVEGSPEYLAANPTVDETFGATAALVYRTGLAHARPSYAESLRMLAESRTAAGIFTAPPGLAAADRDDAFLELAMDVHSGVWGHDPLGTGRAGEFGDYAFASRDAMATGDPETLAWIERFFAPEYTFVAEIDPSLSGTLECLVRGNLPYTQRSRYLRRILLQGSNTAEVLAAPVACWVVGNDGNNNLKGRGGDDILQGGAGFDTAVFDGPLADYTVTFEFGEVFVQDSVPGRDGNDRLKDIERLQFTDQGLNL